MTRYTALGLILTAASGAALGTAAAAQDDAAFEPQVFTVEEAIPEGPNFLVLDQNWSGPSAISVLGADDFAMKGNIGIGTTGQMVLSEDGLTLYAASVYLERYNYGDVTAVLQEYDIPTLSMKREIEISKKLAQVESQPVLMTLIDNGAYALMQNATPATSITVVDLKAGEQIAEVPIPGCWGMIPATEGRKFTTLCGDGRLLSLTFEPDGSFSEPVASEQIFDVDDDALFTNGVRTPEGVVFASFGGNLYFVDDSGTVPTLTRKIEVASTQLGGWAPGGSEVISYNEPTNTAFLLMHPGSYEGSHKNAAKEIWAVDLESGAVVGRAHANDETGILADQSDPPVLYSAGEGGGVFRYTVEPGEEMTISQDGGVDYIGDFLTIMAVAR